MDPQYGNSSMRKDLELTIRELSDTYEELSLLYKLSDVLSGMNVDEIAERVIEETTDTLDVATAALLLLDEDEKSLYTKSCRGRWSRDIVITNSDEIIWAAVKEKKPVAFCALREAGHSGYEHAEKSILVCPLTGKMRVVGALVLADRSADAEFFSNDIKLMMAIASHAALMIENALLYRELEEFFLSAIQALVKALEASSLWTAGHTERVTKYAISIGAEMGLSGKELEKLRLCSLLHDIGKIAIPKEILDKPDALTHNELMEIKRHPLIGVEILGGFKQLQDVLLGIKHHHESWDGSKGLKGEDIPLMARILAVADAFDAMTSDRPYRKKKTKEEATTEIVSLAGRQFDPGVVSAFARWVSQQHHVSSP